MDRNIYIINGPNLNMLGNRQIEVYGNSTLEDMAARCNEVAKEHNITVEYFQSNHEGEIVDVVQNARTQAAGIIINAGAYSHTSVAILDALNNFQGMVVEVHVSNVFKREEFRHNSYISSRADGIMIGLGVKGYELALEYLAGCLK